MTRRRIPRYRRLHLRGRSLPESTRQCGQAGVARAKWALDHHEANAAPEETEQLVLELRPAEHSERVVGD